MTATMKHAERERKSLLEAAAEISKFLDSKVVIPQFLLARLSAIVPELIAEANSEFSLCDAKHDRNSLRLKRKPGIAIIYANKNLPGTVIRDVDGRQDVGTLDGDGIWRPLEKD